MFPIGDDNTQERTVPVVTYALIALNVLFFLVELSGGDARLSLSMGGREGLPQRALLPEQPSSRYQSPLCQSGLVLCAMAAGNH
jgi:hypothetical protein